MNWELSSMPVLTLLTLLPLFGGILVCGLDERFHARCRPIAAGFSLAALALALLAFRAFQTDAVGFQFVERHAWAPSIGVEYHLGVDGLSLAMMLLTGLIFPFALLSSRQTTPKPHLFYGLFLFLEAGLMGAFSALNFYHWFLFWELSQIGRAHV